MGNTRASSADTRKRIARRAKKARLELPASVVDLLADYLDLLTLWNRKVNLTALQDADEAVDRLIVEPALAARLVPAGLSTLMDIGSGGGSPAIPLKLCAPQLRLWMVESKTRKAAFLREAVRQLALSNAEVETRRFEELLTRPDLIEGMDLLTVRAVRLTGRTLLELQSFVRPGGQLWLFSGRSRHNGSGVPPPLQVESVEPLLESLGSHLWRLRKAVVSTV